MRHVHARTYIQQTIIWIFQTVWNMLPEFNSLSIDCNGHESAIHPSIAYHNRLWQSNDSSSVVCALSIGVCIMFMISDDVHIPLQTENKTNKKNSWEIKTSFGCDWLQSQMKFETLATQVSSHLINAKIAWVMCEKKTIAQSESFTLLRPSEKRWKCFQYFNLNFYRYTRIVWCLLFFLFVMHDYR